MRVRDCCSYFNPFAYRKNLESNRPVIAVNVEQKTEDVFFKILKEMPLTLRAQKRLNCVSKTDNPGTSTIIYIWRGLRPAGKKEYLQRVLPVCLQRTFSSWIFLQSLILDMCQRRDIQGIKAIEVSGALPKNVVEYVIIGWIYSLKNNYGPKERAFFEEYMQFHPFTYEQVDQILSQSVPLTIVVLQQIFVEVCKKGDVKAMRAIINTEELSKTVIHEQIFRWIYSNPPYDPNAISFFEELMQFHVFTRDEIKQMIIDPRCRREFSNTAVVKGRIEGFQPDEMLKSLNYTKSRTFTESVLEVLAKKEPGFKKTKAPKKTSVRFSRTVD